MQPLSRFARYAWTVLGWNLMVILWGAFVRASGSGAGCGNHWPLCNGEVVPRSPRIETLIELTHRLTSGLALISVVVLVFWAFRGFPAGHRVRRGAVASLCLMIAEALLGAGLVLFQYVAGNVSIGRAFYLSAHMINTLLLVGAILLTAWWASGGRVASLRNAAPLVWMFGLGLAAALLLGVSGVVTALGDTLFPPASLAAGLRQDFSPASSGLLRLRLLHPVLALLVGGYLIGTAALAVMRRPGALVTRLAWTVAGVVVVQLGLGALNVALLAPTWMQLVHLLAADLVWVSFVLLSAAALETRAGE